MEATESLQTFLKALLLVLVLFGGLQAQSCDTVRSLGIADPNVIASNRIVTSSEAEGNGKEQIRLNCCQGISGSAWCPVPQDKQPYVEIHLDKPVGIGQIDIQAPTVGETNLPYPVNFMKSFDLLIKLPGIDELVRVAQNISAIENKTVSINSISLYPSVFTDVIRIEPRDSENLPCFRMELYQCDTTSMCPLNYCQNNGTCSQPYSCSCPDSYYGEMCQYSKETIPLTVYEFLQISDNRIITTAHSLTFQGDVSLDNYVLALPPGSYLDLVDLSQGSCFFDPDTCLSGFTINLVFSMSHIDTNSVIVLSNGGADDPRVKGITLLFQQGYINCYVSTTYKLWAVIQQFKLTEAAWYKITISWSLNSGLIVLKDGDLIGSTFIPQLLDNRSPKTNVLKLGYEEKTSSAVLHFKEITIAPLDWQEFQRVNLVRDNDEFVDRTWDLRDISQLVIESHGWFLTLKGRPAFGEDGVTLNKDLEISNLGNSCLTNPTLCKDGLTIRISIKFAPIEEGSVVFTTGAENKHHPGVTLLYRYGQLHAIVSTEDFSWFVSVPRETILTSDFCDIILSWSQRTSLKLIINQVLVGESASPIAHPNITLPYIDKLTIGNGLIESVISEIHIWHTHIDRLSERHLIICVPCSQTTTTSQRTTVPTTLEATTPKYSTRETTGIRDSTAEDTTEYYDDDECPIGCVPSDQCWGDYVTPTPEPTPSCDLSSSQTTVDDETTQKKTTSSTTVTKSTSQPSSPPTAVTTSTSPTTSPTTKESTTTGSTPVPTTKPPCPLPTTCPNLPSSPVTTNTYSTTPSSTTGKSTTPPPVQTSTAERPTTPPVATSTTERPTSTTERPTSTTERSTSTTERSTSTTERSSSTTERPTSTTERPTTPLTVSTSTTERPTSTTERPTSTTERPTSTTERPTTPLTVSTSTTERPTSTTERPTSTTERPTSTTERPTTPLTVSTSTTEQTTPKCTSSSSCPTSATSSSSSPTVTTIVIDTTVPETTARGSTTGQTSTQPTVSSSTRAQSSTQPTVTDSTATQPASSSTTTTENQTTPKCTSSSTCPTPATSTSSLPPTTTTATDSTTSKPTTVTDSTTQASTPTTVESTTTTITTATTEQQTTPKCTSSSTCPTPATSTSSLPPTTTTATDSTSKPTTVTDLTTQASTLTTVESTTTTITTATTEQRTTPKCTSSSSCPTPVTTSSSSPPGTTTATETQTTTPQTSSLPTTIRDSTTPETSTVTDSTTQQPPSSSTTATTTEKQTTPKCTSSTCPTLPTSGPSSPTTSSDTTAPETTVTRTSDSTTPETSTVTRTSDSTTPETSTVTRTSDSTTPETSTVTRTSDSTTPETSTVADSTTQQASSTSTSETQTTTKCTSSTCPTSATSSPSSQSTSVTTQQPTTPDSTTTQSTTTQPTTTLPTTTQSTTTTTTQPPCPQPPSSVTLTPEVNPSGQGYLTCSVAVAPEIGITIRFTWRIEGSTVRWSKEIEAPDRSASISAAEINVSILNKAITCTAEVRYSTPNAELCWPARSNVVVPSIKCPPVNGTIKVIEGKEEQFLQIQVTVPPSLLCRPEDNGQCRVEVSTTITTVLTDLRCSLKEVIPQAVLGVSTVGQGASLSCGVSINSVNWNNAVTIPVKATADGIIDGDRNRKLKIAVRIIGQVTSVTTVETCGDIDIIVIDRGDGATCSSVNDPHMKTFDNTRYNNFLAGEFVMYRHRTLPYEVVALYAPCNPKKPKGATCNCGAAVRSGDDVITFDTCNTRQNSQLIPLGNSFITVGMIKNGELTPGTRVISHCTCSQKYEVILPSGTKVIITGSTKPFLNINIQSSSSDFESTEGLCGNFNNKGSDDLDVKNPDVFNKQWLRNVTIFKGVPAFTTPARPTYCSCQSGQQPICQPGLDVYRCSSLITAGTDITGTLVSQAKPPAAFSQVRTIVNQVQSRGRRAVDTTNVQNPAVLDEETGFTEETALQYCQEYIENTPAVKLCLTHLRDDAVNESIYNCASDLVADNETQWATSHVDDLIIECIADVQTNVTIWENNENADGPSVPEYITKSLCTQNCSEHADCENSICKCHDGWIGETCEIGSTTTPTVLPATEVCDVLTSSCNNILVEGNNFIPTEMLTCKIRYITIGEKVTETAEEYRVPASYISMIQIVCPENTARLSPSRSALVTISNNGVSYSNNSYIHVVQKSTCQDCTLADDVNGVSCAWKPGSCVIDNQCYARYETYEADACYRCDPDVSLNQWTKISAPNCTVPEAAFGKADPSPDNTVIITLSVVCGLLALVTVAVIIFIVRSRMRRNMKFQSLWEGERNSDIYHRRPITSSADVSGQSDAARINAFYNPTLPGSSHSEPTTISSE